MSTIVYEVNWMFPQNVAPHTRTTFEPATFPCGLRSTVCSLQPQAVNGFYSLHERLISAHKWDRSDSLDSFRSHNQGLYP